MSADVLVDLRHFRQVEVTRTATGAVWAMVGGGCQIKRVLEQLQRQAGVTLP